MSQKNEAKLADLRLSDIRCDRPSVCIYNNTDIMI